jgi:hypothetical protein
MCAEVLDLCRWVGSSAPWRGTSRFQYTHTNVHSYTRTSTGIDCMCMFIMWRSCYVFFAMSCLAITDLQWRGLDLCVWVDTWNSSLGYGNLRQIHHGLLMPIAQFLGFLPEGSWVSPRPSLCRFDLQPWKP